MAVEQLEPYDHGKRSFGSPRKKVLVIESLKRVLSQQGFDIMDARDNKSIWSLDDLFANLSKYGKVHTLEVDGKSWKRAYFKTLNAFKPDFKVLNKLEDADLPAAVKLNKSSGLPFLDKKRNVIDVELLRMDRIRAGLKAPDPCIAYHRVQHGEKGPKTRLVWGYPLSMTLLEAQFARPLIDHFLCANTPMAFGYTKADLWAKMSDFSSFDTLVGLDYSGFDASVHPRLLLMAFSILERFFSKEEREAGNWEKIVHYFVHTSILMPDGYIYRKHQGIPSGSFFTQLIGSIVNYFSLMYVSDRLGMSGVRAIVLGDDSLASVSRTKLFEANRKFFGDLLLTYSTGMRELGLTIHPHKCKVFYGKSRGAIHFLGHTWSRGYPHREAREIAVRLVYPERFVPNIPVRDYIRQRQLMLLCDAVEAWPVIRPLLGWSRMAVCYTVSSGNLSEEVMDLGWFRGLSSTGRKIPLTKLGYVGLLI